jgi:uncharacterized protein
VADIFRVETDKVYLNWSGRVPSEIGPSSLPPGRLLISLRRADAVYGRETWRAGVPPEAASDPSVQFGPRLYEETTYTVFLRSKGDETVELRHRDPTILQGLTTSDGGRAVHGSVNFKSQIGRSRFTVCVRGEPECDFEVEVFPSKLDYMTDYNALLADVQDILAALVLEYLRSTFKLGFTIHSSTATRLEWLILLRHLIENLERGIRYIERHPHHALTRERLPTRVERLHRPDATIFKTVIQGKGIGPKSRTANGVVVRTKLPESRARTTLDTPEHRWLASQLTRIRRRLAEVSAEEKMRIAAANERSPSPRESRALEEIAALENRIASLQRLEPIAAAQGFPPAGFGSIKLQTAAGYREAYRSCLILLLGLRVDGGPVGLSVKDIHLLYEYWCYLALVRLISNIIGERIPVERLLTVEQNGLWVRLQRGQRQTLAFTTKAGRILELTYNPRYMGGGFILPQQPDVVLTLRDPEWPIVRLVLDAKYRILTTNDYVAQFGSPGPPPDAINVLHRYRDAILEQPSAYGPRSETLKRSVVEGVTLFPYVDDTNRFRHSRLWTSLERLGIGALPFLPSETRYVEEWLRAVLRRGGWSTAENSIPSAAHERMRSWQEAAREAVLVGVLRLDAEEHLQWILTERCYYTPLTPTQRRQFVARWIAIYSPVSLRSPGAVTYAAPVEGIQVIKRKDIATPWPASRPDELQVVYELGEVSEVIQPIENRGADGHGTRFSQNRWTSQLALLRAGELRELFLETEPEWRLYEEFRVAGVDFDLKPVTASVQPDDDPRGRTWFVTRSARVQYRGSAGFLIRRDSCVDEYQPNVATVLRRLLSFL